MGKGIIILLLIIPYIVFSQKIDAEKFLKNGNSIMQFYEFERAMQRNEEIAALYFAMGNQDWKDDREIIKQCINEEKKLKLVIQKSKVEDNYTAYKNDILSLVDININAFDNLYKYGPESAQFKKSNEIYQPKLHDHLHTLTSYFDMGNYVEIDSAQVCESQLKAYDIPFKQKEEVKRLLADKKIMAAYQLLQSDNGNLSNDCALIYLSDVLLKTKYSDSLKIDNKDSLGVNYLYTIINKNTYSPFLFDGWRKWRAIKQNEYGASKTSEIPNDLYDTTRIRLMRIVLEHIKNNPSDTWAYIQFFNLNETEIIHRFGDYPYGNQSAVERWELFYN